MLKGNLSTRPFYNQRVVHLGLAVVAVVVLALTAYNTLALVSLTGQRAVLRQQIDADLAEAARIRQDAAALQRTVNRAAMQALHGSATEANRLIDERTFSWTTFFGLIEQTIPYDVRLTAVVPQIEGEEIQVTIFVITKQADALDMFMKALEATGAFYDVLPRQDDRNDDGTYRGRLITKYLPPAPVLGASSAATGDRQP